MSSSQPTDGLRGAYEGHSVAVKATFASFLAIALYNSIELVVLIFATFYRYRGLYFWSLLLSTAVGVILQSLSFILKYFSVGPDAFSLTISTIGWYFMVTGQAVVLYSRLNLVVQDPRVLKRVLAMIIVDAICLHIPTTVLTYGSNFSSNPIFLNGYSVMERIELTGFCLQEFIISGLYIKATVKLLKMDSQTSDSPKRGLTIMYQLLGINFLIIMLDVVLIVVEYLSYFVIQTTLKCLVYSIKLKLEFAVLGRLVFIVRSHQYHDDPAGHGRDPRKYPDFVDVTRIAYDFTHAPTPAGHVSHPWEELGSKS